MQAVYKVKIQPPKSCLFSTKNHPRSFTTSILLRDHQRLDDKLLVEALRGQTESNGFPPMDYSRKQKEKKAPAIPRPSASVLLVSPNNQVLLLQRVKQSSSFASAHVFPGGKISSNLFNRYLIGQVADAAGSQAMSPPTTTANPRRLRLRNAMRTAKSTAWPPSARPLRSQASC